MKKKKKDKYDKLKEIDIDVRRSFGKFYVFSILIFVFLMILAFLVNKLNIWFTIVVLVFILLFFIFMIVDLVKKRSKYWTFFASLLILIFLLLYSLDIIKIVFFLIK